MFSFPQLSSICCAGEERQTLNAQLRKVDAPLPQNFNSEPQHHPAVDPHAPPGTPLAPPGITTLGGSNADVVNNRAAIRMANMSAAETLKAELVAKIPLGRKTPANNSQVSTTAPFRGIKRKAHVLGELPDDGDGGPVTGDQAVLPTHRPHSDTPAEQKDTVR